jgi:glycosyltransferase involved in cell wall biosynthesis
MTHDFDFKNKTFKSFDERKGILFLAGFLHKPNVDGAIWLCNKIMPIIWKKFPNMNVNIVGSNPPEEIQKLSNNRIHVPGYVPDLSNYFNNSRVFVAPLRYGAGIKGKLIYSFENKLPVVTTSIGVEGMDLKDGEDILIGNSSKEFADRVIELYSNKRLWEKLHKNSKDLLKPYLPITIKKSIFELIESLEKGKLKVKK